MSILQKVSRFCNFVSRKHTNVVSDAAFSADERNLVTVSWDKSIALWDISTGMYRCTVFATEISSQAPFSTSPGGHKKHLTAYLCALECVDEWNYFPAHCLAFHHLSDHEVQRKSPRLMMVPSALVTSPQTVRYGLNLNLSLLNSRNEHCMMARKPESSVTAFPGSQLATASYDRTLAVWDLTGHKPVQKLKLQVRCAWQIIQFVQICNKGVLSTLSRTKKIHISPQGHRGWVEDVCFSADGNWLASCSKVSAAGSPKGPLTFAFRGATLLPFARKRHLFSQFLEKALVSTLLFPQFPFPGQDGAIVEHQQSRQHTFCFGETKNAWFAD